MAAGCAAPAGSASCAWTEVARVTARTRKGIRFGMINEFARASLEQARAFCCARLGALVVGGLVRARARNRADDFTARVERHAAAEREDAGHVALRQTRRIVRRRRLELRRRATEHDRRVRLAARHLESRRMRKLMAQHDQQIPRAIDDRDARAKPTRRTFG